MTDPSPGGGFLGALPWRRAFAELVVIVLGVLIAFWVEDFRAIRQDRADEQIYLARLVEDLVADSVALEGALRGTDMHRTMATRALAFLESPPGEPVDTLRVVEAFHMAGFINFFRFAQSTYDDLQSTGNLRLITDPNLRARLGSYYRSGAFLDEFDDAKKQNIWLGYRSLLARYIPGRVTQILDTRSSVDGEPVLDAGADDLDFSRVDLDGIRADAREWQIELDGVIGSAGVETRNLMRIRELRSELAALVRENRS